MKDNKTLGERLKRNRMVHGYSQEKLGEILNVNRVSVYNYEKGKNKPSIEIIEKLAKLYETTPEYLMFGIDNQKIDNIVIEEREETQTLEDTTQDSEYIGDLINYIVKHRETAKILYKLIKSIEKSKK